MRSLRVLIVTLGLALGGCVASAEAPAPRPAMMAHGAALPAPTADNSCRIPGLRESVLRQLNAARAAAHRCGEVLMPPTSRLVWDDQLFAAAAMHSADMARRNYFDHATPEGQRVGARAAAQGYNWRAIGENLAGGDRTVESVMRGWMDSPTHCQNIMNSQYTDVGVACAQRTGSTWGTYWTMVLGRRR